MPYDERTAQRVRRALAGRDFVEKKVRAGCAHEEKRYSLSCRGKSVRRPERRVRPIPHACALPATSYADVALPVTARRAVAHEIKFDGWRIQTARRPLE